MKKQFSSVRFIDSLAEITSHDDREVIERSLLATLYEFNESSQYWLYQVLTRTPELSLGLLAVSSHRHIVTSDQVVTQDLPEHISQKVIEAIEQVRVLVISAEDNSDDQFIIYPAENHDQDVFAVLIERTSRQSLEDQRMVHGFLRIYANYLRLLDCTRRDKLTGVLNRETLDSEITRIIILNNERVPHGPGDDPEVKHDSRNKEGEFLYWLGVLDIDHFKKINDTFGHLYGDEVLILVSRLMEKSIRNYDLVFRYGGEEFVILIKAVDEEDALLAFERIRLAVGHHDYAKAEHVTVSIGVTMISSQSGASEVIAESDAALYYAKEHGRDQVRFYQDLLDSHLIQRVGKEIEIGTVNYF